MALKWWVRQSKPVAKKIAPSFPSFLASQHAMRSAGFGVCGAASACSSELAVNLQTLDLPKPILMEEIPNNPPGIYNNPMEILGYLLRQLGERRNFTPGPQVSTALRVTGKVPLVVRVCSNRPVPKPWKKRHRLAKKSKKTYQSSHKLPNKNV